MKKTVLSRLTGFGSLRLTCPVLIPIIFLRRTLMKQIPLNVQKEFCDECSLALRRFVGKMDGVNSIDVEDGEIVISFDDSKILEADVLKISRESVEKLGYKILD
jgi:copper chaperone CopZ